MFRTDTGEFPPPDHPHYTAEEKRKRIFAIMAASSGTTATYVSAVALRGLRGFLSSFQYVALIGGQLPAVYVIVILRRVLDEAELKAWGWRIPSVVGAVAALAALFLRRPLHATST